MKKKDKDKSAFKECALNYSAWLFAYEGARDDLFNKTIIIDEPKGDVVVKRSNNE